MVNFANLDSEKGLVELNNFLADKSFIEGYQASQADLSVFKQVGKAPDAQRYAYVSRWFNHINSFSEDERTKFPAADTASASTPQKDDEIDLFGDDEDDEEYERQLEERKNAALAAKGGVKKDKPVAKSSLVIDVKPWDDETPMDELEKSVRSIEIEGLVWAKLVPVGYGIKKLQIGAVVVDDLVSIEDLEERIVSFEDYVQSMDVAAFNKI